MRIVFIGGTGAVGGAAVPRALAAGHEVAVAHSGRHEPPAFPDVEHLHGEREDLLRSGGAVERWRPEVLIDTFSGGATASKARELGDVALRSGAGLIVAVSSIDVYRHCAVAGVDGHEPAALAVDVLPLREDAVRRSGPSPAGGLRRDNVAMEDSLHGADRITILRPGAIYGRCPHESVLREWYFVDKIARGNHRLPLPDGGTQIFHRVSLERVADAICAAIALAPSGRWACNVADPQDFTFGALAQLVARQFDWTWEPVAVDWKDGDHPWNVRHPVIVDTVRMRSVLHVAGLDAHRSTADQLQWLWKHRADVQRLKSSQQHP